MSKTLTLAATVLLSVAASAQSDQYPGSHASNGDSSRQYNRSQHYTGDSSGSPENSTGATRVRPLNKASHLIGAEVLNRSNEPLGEIRDVVVDFNTGRVAYFVVDASEILGDQNRTLIAVPARALHVNTRQNTLEMNADRTRIEQTRAFGSNSYPPIRSQAAQMARWQNQQNSGSQDAYSDSDHGTWNQNNFSSSANQNGQWRNRTADQDNDGYVYEWYLIPSENGDQASNFDNSEDYANNPFRSQENSRGAFGQSQSGASGNHSQSNDFEQSQDSRGRQSSPSFNGEPSADSRWLGYNRYYRQQQRNQNIQNQSSTDQSEAQNNSGQGAGQSSQSYSSTSATSGNLNSSRNGNNSQRISGWIRDIDPANRTLVVESNNRTVQLQVAENATIEENGRNNIDLTQLQHGQRVDVGYNYRDGANRAFTINERSSANQTSGQSENSQSGSTQSNQQTQ